MNCKPGDLAVIVQGELTENIGAIVRVLGPENHPRVQERFWRVESEGRRLAGFGWGDIVSYGIYANVADSEMRPIQDPDEDATDETLAWLPSREKVSA